MFKLAPSNDLESERVAKSQTNLPHKHPDSNKCTPAPKEDHSLHQNLLMNEAASENRGQTAKACLLKSVSSGEP